MIRVCKPSELSDKQRADFLALVGERGGVDRAYLPGLLANACAVVTLHKGAQLIGSAAIKNPATGYHSDVFKKAGVADKAGLYPVELGWIAVHSLCEGNGHSSTLASAALGAVSDRHIYATTRDKRMHHVLGKFGFAQLGAAYESKEEPGKMVALFVRPLPE